jgi:AGZA family xanthine/uracil permease-like MFS transporter
MLGATVVALAAGLVRFEGVVAMPPSLAPTFLQLDILGALQPALFDVVLVFFLLALFDSIGTLIAVAGRIGIVRPASALRASARSRRSASREGGNGTLPRVRQALLADAAGTVVGAGLGTSTVTAYIESSTGVAAGGRTGLASMVTAALFLVALFFHPLVRMIGGGILTDGGVLYPIVAPALVIVGVMMMESVRQVPWEDFTEAFPAFLTLVTIPLAVSITDGIAFGFISYAVVKLATGRGRELHWLGYVFAVALLLRYVWN